MGTPSGFFLMLPNAYMCDILLVEKMLYGGVKNVLVQSKSFLPSDMTMLREKYLAKKRKASKQAEEVHVNATEV